MKLTLKIKLLPDNEQAKALVQTIERFNTSCNYISEQAFKEKKFNQIKLHHITYYQTRDRFKLPSQLAVRAISKVADSYKLDKKVQREFRLRGAITYDSRLLTYKPENIVSISTLEGREKIPYVCHRPDWIPYIKGEADLIFKKGKFYLLQTIEFPEEKVKDMDEFLGVDFGLTDIAVSSDGKIHSAKWINEYREHRQKVRSSIQRKGTKSSKRLLKRLSGRGRTTANIVNHTISKSIVASAKQQGKGIAIEDLTGIRFTSKRRGKKFRTKLGRWNFSDLRLKIAYKCVMGGVKLVVVDPRYTSQTCSCCNRIGTRKNKSFVCNCGNSMDADVNASKNIASLAASINKPEESNMFCSIVNHFSGSKPIGRFANG